MIVIIILNRRGEQRKKSFILQILTTTTVFMFKQLFTLGVAYCSSVVQMCLTLCDPICSTPSFLVLHHLLEFAQTHVH